VTPNLNSLLGILFVLFGAGAVLVMIHLRGQPKDRVQGKTLIWIHKILGYLFFALFFVMLGTMISRTGNFQQELSPRIFTHAALALALVPLLAVKWLVARKYRLLQSHLFSLGVTIFLFAFLLVSISAGSHYLYKGELKNAALSSAEISPAEKNNGKLILEEKCTSCHDLNRVHQTRKSEEEWLSTLERMKEYARNPDLLSGDETEQLVAYLVKRDESRLP
jgi:hypothetical protein